MLVRDDLLLWFQQLGLPEQTRPIIDTIRSSGPARRVGGGKSNVGGRYPSRKMGVSIQFESHRVELAGIYEMEHDPEVLEYYDQPSSIKLDYEKHAGKRMGVLHTPDFFVIRKQEAGWEEWKTEEDLRRLSEQNSNRYRPGAAGTWCCPPGTAYAEGLGLYYRVRSSSEIDWVFQRNIQFLDDYLRRESPEIASTTRDITMACLTAMPGVTLADLLQLTKDKVSPDDVFAMIAADVLCVDWRAAPLAEPARVKIFSTPEAIRQHVASSKPDLLVPIAKLRCGSEVTWDGRLWRVVNLGDTSLSLLSEDHKLTELPTTVFEGLVRENRVQIADDPSGAAVNSAARDRLSRASEADLQTATYRSSLINSYRNTGTLPPSADVTRRTFFRWLARYREAEAMCGSGFLGLLPQCSERGNRTARLPETSRRLMQECIEQDYETLTQKTKYASWIKLKLTCEARAIPAPSYKTFCASVRQRPTVEQTLKRKGPRASYPMESFYWELDLKTPRHGDRPFEVVHVDHTELDVECIAGSGQALGRPWLTLLTDAFSRRTLAFYLTFDPPSYRSCMMILRECVRRFARFPQILVMDGGREFGSTYFETLLARYECTKKTRPPAKARFGSTCERLFGIVNTQFIHNLKGNTQITRNVRQVTKAVNPKEHATWPLPELHGRLSEYLYEVYDTLNHPAFGQSPREAFQLGLAQSGARVHRAVIDNEEFRILTLPTTSKGTAKVMPSAGVKINHIYYWCEAFRQFEGQVVPVRYDPFDADMAYAFIQKQWLRCYSDCYGTLKGRSEREMMLATEELRQRHRKHSGSFSWRDHFRRLLLEMEEPLVDYKINPEAPHHLGPSVVRFVPSAKAVGAEYQHALERALAFRRPIAVLVDEAQHLARMGSGRRLSAQLDVIKSLANRTKTVHVLIGTYELLAFRNLSGQLSRRSVDIHFHRYRVDDPADTKAFRTVLRSFEQQLPLAQPPDLVNEWEYLYERSIGCVGVLKDWLLRGLVSASRRDARVLTVRDLQTHALSVAQCDKMLAEALEGENVLSESAEARNRLRSRLGLSSNPSGEDGLAADQATSTPSPPARTNSLKPGQRRPNRDPVGIPETLYANPSTV